DIATAAGSGIGRILSVKHVTLAILDTEDVVFDIIGMAIDENHEAVIQKHRRGTLERTALGQTFEEQTSHFFQKGDSVIETFDDLREAYQAGENASMILPLLAGGQCVGVLHLGASDIYAFNQHNLLRRIAQFVATAIENARLFNQAVNLRVLNESVIESIQQGIVVLDNSGRIITINDFMRRRYGWTDEALYKDLFSYREHWREFLADNLRIVLEEGRPTEILSQSSVDVEGHDVLRNFYVYPLRSGEAIRGAVLLVEDVTERVRLEKAIENRANQLAALTEVSTRITSALERSDVIMQALEEMSWIIDYDTMTIWRRNGPYMVLEGERGVDAQIGMRIRFSEDARVNQMIESRRTVIDGDPDGLKEGLLPGDIGAKSWLGVPLVNQGNIVGMMVLTKDIPGFYEARADQHVAMAFASQVAIALANADLFEQMFARTNELGTLLEAAQATSLTLELDEVLRTVVELMFSALEMDDCAILEWDEVDNSLSVLVNLNRDGDETHIMARGTELSLTDYPAKYHVLQNREVIVLVDTEELEENLWPKELEELREQGYGARMLVPLLVREQVIGLIQLQQRSNKPVTQQKVRLARALGAQVAVAIENARLTAEQNANFEELLTINTLSQAISSTLNLDDMIQVIRQQVPPITGANEMYLALYDSETDEITFPLVVQGGDVVDVPPRMLGDDEVSYVIKKRRTLTLGADYYSLDELRRSLGIINGEGDIKSYMGVPLIAGDQVMGVLAVRDRERTRAFDVNVERILTTVASQLAAAIQNARLFTRISSFADELERLVEERTTELEQERDRLDTLYRITSELTQTLDMDLLLARALEMVGQAVNADDGAILLSDPITDNLYSRSVLNDDAPIIVNGNEHRYHPAEQVATWLIQHEQYVVVNDLHKVDFWDPDAPG
ncbi:MAG: GAF domain-containing protein, partial [Chloroflexi bacterium]